MTYSSELAAQRLHALINSRPSSPSIDEMEAIIAEAQIETAEAAKWPANKLQTEIRETIAAWQDALLIDDLPGDEIVEGLEATVEVLAAQLPERAGTLSEIISRAEIAWFWADKEYGEKLTALAGDGDCTDVAMGNLIVAVLQFAGLGKIYKVEG